jgi:hypothetical protein
MKQNKIGKIAFLVLLFGIPMLVDGLMWLLIPAFREFSMTGFIIKGYLGALPLFVCYLLIASVVIYLWNKNMKKL